MNARKLLDKLEKSNLTAAEVLELIFEKGYATKVDFPNAFDSSGNTLIRIDKKAKMYNTYCPFHDNQSNGDSFAVYNERQNVYCYSGDCAYNTRPMNFIELVMATVLKIDYSVVFEFELAKEHFWTAARFLVEHFGDRIGADLKEIDNRRRNSIPVKDRILKDTAEYYHFLGKKNEFYNKKLTEFLTETRHFDKGIVPVQEIIKEHMLGITPISKEKNRLFEYLKKRKYTEDEILESKVCIRTRKGEIIDFFNERAIVPYIYNGKVIGLYGRDMRKDGDKKFRHMRLEGEVNIPNGLDNILKQEEFFLVEGEFSKTAINVMGRDNVMEARGVNGFSKEHAELIGRIRKRNPNKCKVCYIAFDPDNAGATSVEKIGERLIEVGVEVKVIRLPVIYENNKTVYIDPNDLLEVYGEEASEKFNKMVEESISYDAFILLHKINKNRPQNLSEARMALKNLGSHLDGIPEIEKIFILEEFLEVLSTAIDKDLLRSYLLEVWIKNKN